MYINLKYVSVQLFSNQPGALNDKMVNVSIRLKALQLL